MNPANVLSTVLTGNPYVIARDQTTQFTADYVIISCSQFGIMAKEALNESHNSLSLCTLL